MVWIPTVRVDVLMETEPLELSVPVPSCVVPSRKLTVPVGVALPTVGLTFASNVMLLFAAMLLVLACSVVAEGSAPTFIATAEDTLLTSPLSPLYESVIECAPIVMNVDVQVATALELSVPVQSNCAPSWNTTLPVGTPVPLVGTTTAVSVSRPPAGIEAEVTLRWVVVEVTEAETVTLTAADVLALSVVSPAYEAVME